MASGSSTPSRGTDLWLHLSGDVGVRFGAFLSKDIERQSELITVFWHGNLSTYIFRNIIDETENLYRDDRNFKGKFLAFGAQRSELELTRPNATSYITSDYEAFRVEFEGDPGDITIWANVKQSEMIGVNDLNENIGICVNPDLYDSLAKSLILHSMCRTSGFDEHTVERLLDGLAVEIKNRSK